MGKLSTHILDLALGKPAAGMRIELYRVTAQAAGAGAGAGAETATAPLRQLIKAEISNSDGRTASPLLEADHFVTGMYELVFSAGDYFAAQGQNLPQPRFVDRVTLAFGIADTAQNYHVPLLVSPWAYSTYRGS